MHVSAPESPRKESADDYDDKLSGVGRETGKRSREMESTLSEKKTHRTESDSNYIVRYNTYLSGNGRLGPQSEEVELLYKELCGDDDDEDDDPYLGWTLMYDHHTPGHEPNLLLHSQRLSKLAIDSYNQKYNTKFCVVGVVRAIGLVVSGFYSYLKFTANQSGADAITFTAEVYEPLQKEPIVESVDIVAEGAILPVDTLPASYNPCCAMR